MRERLLKNFSLLRSGGSFWVTVLVIQEIPAVDELMRRRYVAYLESLGGVDYREEVFKFIDQEDSPGPLTYQLDLMRRARFFRVDVLHKNSCFAAFGAVKA